MDPQNIRVLIAVLVPIAPALMIFWLLPGSAEVEGPYQGLKVKLGGAFGGYFLVMLSIFAYFLANPFPQGYEVWRIQGRISDTAIMPSVSLVPAPEVVEKTGQFTVMSVVEKRVNGTLRYPSVMVEKDGYYPVSIPLDPDESKAYGAPYKPKIQSDIREITIVEAIELKKKEATK